METKFKVYTKKTQLVNGVETEFHGGNLPAAQGIVQE